MVFVDLPKVGAKIACRRILRHRGIRESRQRNLHSRFRRSHGNQSALVDAPEKINDDPHGTAWLVKIKLADPKEVASLMDAAAYEAYIAEQAKEHSA